MHLCLRRGTATFTSKNVRQMFWSRRIRGTHRVLDLERMIPIYGPSKLATHRASTDSKVGAGVGFSTRTPQFFSSLSSTKIGSSSGSSQRQSWVFRGLTRGLLWSSPNILAFSLPDFAFFSRELIWSLPEQKLKNLCFSVSKWRASKSLLEIHLPWACQ